MVGGREGREGKRKGGEGREEGDVGGPRDILSRGPEFLVTPLTIAKTTVFRSLKLL